MSRMAFLPPVVLTIFGAALALNACSTKNGVEDDSASTGGASPFVPQGGASPYNPGAGGSGANTGGSTAAPQTITPWPPSADYINVTNVTAGAYALGPDISNGDVPANTGTTCQGMLFGVVRDFRMGTSTGGHPDFETAPDSTGQNGVPGIVASTLGDDGKPIYAFSTDPLAGVTSEESFNQWYRDVPDVNMTYIVALKLTSSNGISSFSASVGSGGFGQTGSSFFPLDNAGFGNEGQTHNFAFTTEIHTSFVYSGGETFTFVGDDDVWVFINNQLVIDLGGRHGQLDGSVALDTLGLTIGSPYSLDVFNAERHTTQSNFRIDTTLTLADCGQVNDIIIN